MTEERLQRLFSGDNAGLTVCVGSWKAYNECNEHALGSCLKTSDGKIHFYIDFMELEGSDELREALYAIGWSEAEMEETFVQDYCSGWAEIEDCDHQNAFDLADFIYEHRDEIDGNEEKLKAIMEMEADSIELAIEYLEDYDYRDGMTPDEYAMEITEESLGDFPEWVSRYIDYDVMGRDMVLNGDIIETEDGLLIRY